LRETAEGNGRSAAAITQRSLVENLMYRLKTRTGNCLWARTIGSQATEVAVRVGVLNRMTALARVRNPLALPEFKITRPPLSSNPIYATTP
jgi:hypothetical protein